LLLCVALRVGYLAALGVAFVVSTGCGTLPNGEPGERWGERAFEFDRERIGRAARDAALDPQTWVPALGAAVFAIDDWDERVSDWAVDRTPIFGSNDSADDASDTLSFILGGEAVLTALATPSGERPAGPKTKGVAVEAAAVGLTAGTVGLLKNVVGRSRPLDSSSTSSFPSSHAAIAFSLSTLSNRNLGYLDMPRGARTALRIGNVALATGVAWARVEAGKHYPSDVLVGAALGHFLTAFVHDAFLGLPDDSDLDFAILSVPVGGGATVVGFSFRY
jgi:hypothetical protein